MAALERLAAWLHYEPDPRAEGWPRPWQVQAGDVVEVHQGERELGQFPVRAASARAFKLSDGRTFAQKGGWSLFRPSQVRARKVVP